MSTTNDQVIEVPAKAMTRRRAQAEQTRRKLIRAAVEHFSTRPYDDVAVSDIAETAGAAQGLVFHYFDSKRGIYLEALREAAAQLEAAHIPGPEGPPGQQLRRMLRTHLAYMGERHGLALRLVLGGSGGDPEAWEIFEHTRWRTIAWTCRLLGLDVERPALRLMLRAAAGAVDEATGYWLNSGHPFDTEEIAEGLVDLIITALRGATRLDHELDVEAAIALLRQT